MALAHGFIVGLDVVAQEDEALKAIIAYGHLVQYTFK